jgi:hypothetical protein
VVVAQIKETGLPFEGLKCCYDSAFEAKCTSLIVVEASMRPKG